MYTNAEVSIQFICIKDIVTEGLFGDNFMILKCLGKLNGPAELNDAVARIYSRIFENTMSEY